MKLRFIINVLNPKYVFIFFTFIIFSSLEFMYAYTFILHKLKRQWKLKLLMQS